MERDEETGLNYHGARYYAPWLGRWASADPVGIEGGINLYRYSKLNPLIFNDKTGLQPENPEAPHDAGILVPYTARTADDQTSYWVSEEELKEGANLFLKTVGLLAVGAILVAAPILIPEIAAYESGLSLAEVITGKSTGIHIANLLTRNIDSGRTLSKGERALAGVSTVLGAVGLKGVDKARAAKAVAGTKTAAAETVAAKTKAVGTKPDAPHVGASPTTTPKKGMSTNVADAGKDACVGNVCAIMKNKELGAGPGEGGGYTARELEIAQQKTTGKPFKFGRPASGESNPATATVGRSVRTIEKVTDLRATNAKSPINFAAARAEGQYAIFVTNSHVVYGNISQAGRVSILDANVGRGWSSWDDFLSYAKGNPTLYGSNPAATNQAFHFVPK
jgi:RHS repeat-associated protein